MRSRVVKTLAGGFLAAMLFSSAYAEDVAQEEAQKTVRASIVKNTNVSSYIDVGMLSSQLWGFMNWWPVVELDMTKYDQYLVSLFSQLKGAGINQIYLSFGQIAGIDALLKDGVGSSTDDVICRMMIDFPGAFQELVKQAHLAGIKVILSFGGENGTSMTICKAGQTPQGQAQKLVSAVQKFSLDGVDFDIENTFFSKSNPDTISQTFFKTLYQQLSTLGKTSTLTVMGGIYDWPLGYLKGLFFDSTGKGIVSQLFHYLNLMLYSQTQYYLDANHPTWGIEQWLNLIGKQNSGMIQIGFEDAIDYSKPATSAGGTYTITTTNPGTAAAQIYIQLLQKLTQDGYPVNFGPTFFWPDNNRTAPGTWRRYQAITQNGKIIVKFAADRMQTFHDKIVSG